MFCRLLLTALATLSFSLAPGAVLVALADDPAPTPSPSFRPPVGVLRHVDAPTASPVAPANVAAPKKELVILVGGYQTCWCKDGLDAYAARASAAGYDVKHFGADPRYPYDSYGAIAVSGRSLRDEIRSLAPDYSAVHIVTHSMGGVVADQAFAQGLSASDGVATYVSLSGPHSGSDWARAATDVNTNGPGELLRRVASLFEMESKSAAVKDLASVHPIVPPVGVVRLDLRESTDVLVTSTDASDPGVPSRILNEAAEGHGGILTDPRAVDLTMRTISTRRVPPDDRARALVDATDLSSLLIALLATAVAVALAGLLCFVYRLPGVRIASTLLTLLLPPARRKPCP